MEIQTTPLDGLLHIRPVAYGDSRGFFLEGYNRKRYLAAGFPDVQFVQDNCSRSCHGVLRGLHFQRQHPQGKLVFVVTGSVFDVAVDLRSGSSTFGQWYGCELSAENHHQLWIPPGFAHGFCVLSETTDFFYKCTDYYHPEDEGGVIWNDPEIAIHWPIEGVCLSDKDRALPRLSALASGGLPLRN